MFCFITTTVKIQPIILIVFTGKWMDNKHDISSHNININSSMHVMRIKAVIKQELCHANSSRDHPSRRTSPVHNARVRARPLQDTASPYCSSSGSALRENWRCFAMRVNQSLFILHLELRGSDIINRILKIQFAFDSGFDDSKKLNKNSSRIWERARLLLRANTIFDSIPRKLGSLYSMLFAKKRFFWQDLIHFMMRIIRFLFHVVIFTV